LGHCPFYKLLLVTYGKESNIKLTVGMCKRGNVLSAKPLCWAVPRKTRVRTALCLRQLTVLCNSSGC
jgi:hypothetical protein